MTHSPLDDILLPGHALTRLGHVWSALSASEGAASYDRKAAMYDAIVGRSLYQRVFWGTSAAAYGRFAGLALEDAGGGRFAEVGCGSLLFTHRLHRERGDPSTVLVDRSLSMLQRAARRLRLDATSAARLPALLHADAARAPLRAGVLRSILCLNLLHVPCDAIAIAREFGRLLEPGRGRLFVSCLVRTGRWADAYMRILVRAGELRKPWTVAELERAVAADWGTIESARVAGSMCFMVIRHADRAAARRERPSRDDGAVPPLRAR